MDRFVKSEVVVVPFPFSDLTRSKRRPALVVAVVPGDDLILCKITSRGRNDTDAVALNDSDLATGGLGASILYRVVGQQKWNRPKSNCLRSSRVGALRVNQHSR